MPCRDGFMYKVFFQRSKIVGLFSAIITAALFFLPSCGFDMGDDNFAMSYNPALAGNTESETPSMEESPKLEYSMPEMIPGVLVDRDGYSSNEVKFANVFSEKLPDEYYVYDTETGERVYVGTPEEVIFDEEASKYSAKLIFENIEGSGRYYIYADGLGSSYSFQVSENYYRDIYWNLISSECDRIKNEDVSPWEVYTVLYSYERYKDVLYALKEDAPDVLGAVGNWISKTDLDALNGADCYISVAILSKFGFNYKNVDQTLATECIQKASALYKEHPLSAENDTEKQAAFLALAELYRTSATRSYAAEILGMKDYLTSERELYDSRYILYGAMGYMTTRHSVDRSLCDDLMENLLYKCRDMNDDKKLIETDKASSADKELLLVYAQQFAAMNYILDGYEYNEQILNIRHFLSGRNTQGFVCDIVGEYPSDAVAIYAWLAWLENNGKLDPSAPVIWNYSW